jgi:hypothetical protein
MWRITMAKDKLLAIIVLLIFLTLYGVAGTMDYANIIG